MRDILQEVNVINFFVLLLRPLGPNHSKFSDESSRRNSNGPESLNNLAQEVRGSFRDGFQDYVKDVPVELFTISKMVVNVPKQNNKT